MWLVVVSILVTVIILLIWSHLLNHDILDVYIVIDHWLLLRLIRQILLRILLRIWQNFYRATLTSYWSLKSILTHIEYLRLLLVLQRLSGCCNGWLGEPNAIPTGVWVSQSSFFEVTHHAAWVADYFLLNRFRCFKLLNNNWVIIILLLLHCFE